MTQRMAIADKDITDKERLWALRRALGYIENASDRTVTMCQDDATKIFFIRVGKDSVNGNGFTEAMNNLVRVMRDDLEAELAEVARLDEEEVL